MNSNLSSYINFSLANDSTECQRLFHGRGHTYEGLEHINIDWLPPVVLITSYRESSEQWLQDVTRQILDNMPACQSVQVQHRNLPLAPFEVLSGKKITELEVIEHGLKYHVELGRWQNIGIFLDMSNGRRWVMDNAQGKKILNLFSFTCPFSVAALAGGASHVFNVDNNSGVLTRGRENHRLNNIDMRSVSFDKIDIFKSFGRLKKHGPYDLMISDPPSFQQGSVNIKRDYSKIVRRIPLLIQPGGKIMLCLNSTELTEGFLYDLINEECPDCQFVEAIKPPAVFKEAVQGKGLKVLVFEYQP
ncbi:MAG: class I SAM-dependent methyltransferase [Gammaproteobacteria bacterium]|nr:class I SAM-dependent methyltransferase [Gammaproteobacteria bacterium]